MDSVKFSSSVLSDVSQPSDLTARAFATTLFPVSSIFNSCFKHQNTSTDSSECCSAQLTFGTGNYWYSIYSLIVVYYGEFSATVSCTWTF